jgi:transcriptional regulator GlxA family with amidase domain
LAETGLMDGRRATTHWAYGEPLAARYPGVRLEPDALFVRDGAGPGAAVWTSAGVTAGMDLALALVEEDHGPRVSLEAARWLVMFVQRPGGQSQFSAQLASQLAERDALRELQAWIAERPTEDLRVEALAAKVAMSPRHFARVFRAEVGLTPARYVERARVEVARRLLERTGLGLEQIADASGFRSAQRLRRALSRHLGVTPSDYRARFRAPMTRRDRPLTAGTGD